MLYPAFYYIKMIINSSKNNRKHFAKAYKCYGMTSVIVYGVYVLLIVAILLLDNSDVSETTIAILKVIGVYILQIRLVGHFVKVVHEYADRLDQGQFIKA